MILNLKSISANLSNFCYILYRVLCHFIHVTLLIIVRSEDSRSGHRSPKLVTKWITNKKINYKYNVTTYWETKSINYEIRSLTFLCLTVLLVHIITTYKVSSSSWSSSLYTYFLFVSIVVTITYYLHILWTELLFLLLVLVYEGIINVCKINTGIYKNLLNKLSSLYEISSILFLLWTNYLCLYLHEQKIHLNTLEVKGTTSWSMSMCV